MPSLLKAVCLLLELQGSKTEVESEDAEERGKGKRPTNRPQHQKKAGRSMEIPIQESTVKEVQLKGATPSKDTCVLPSHALRRTPRKQKGQKTTVSEFAKQLQGKEEEAVKATKKLKLAGITLDPHVMSTSEDNDESDATHTVRRSPRTSPRKQERVAAEEIDKEGGTASMPPRKQRFRPPSINVGSSTELTTERLAGRSSMEAALVPSRKRGRPPSFGHSGGTVTVIEVDLTALPSDKRRKVTPTGSEQVTNSRESASPRRGPRFGVAGPSAKESGSELSRRQSPHRDNVLLGVVEDHGSTGPSGTAVSISSSRYACVCRYWFMCVWICCTHYSSLP